MKRELAEQSGAPGVDKFELAFGRNREAARRKYEGLSIRELDRLANDTSILAAELRALVWERMWSVPNGN